MNEKERILLLKQKSCTLTSLLALSFEITKWTIDKTIKFIAKYYKRT